MDTISPAAACEGPDNTALGAAASAVLEKDGFLIMNTYSPTMDVSAIQLLAEMYFPDRNFEVKELWMKTTTGKDLYFGNLLRVQGVKD